MKKMLLLLAGMACLGMFVSCSDDPQEVVVTNQLEEGTEWNWAGTVTGSVTDSYYSIAKVDEDNLAVLEYAVVTKGNMKLYTLKVPVLCGNTESVLSGNIVDVIFYKVGNDYYDKGTGKKLTVTGLPEGNEFTIASIKNTNTFMTMGSGGNTFTNLKFKRK